MQITKTVSNEFEKTGVPSKDIPPTLILVTEVTSAMIAVKYFRKTILCFFSEVQWLFQ